MFDWLQSFLVNIFGSFWGSLTTWALKFLMGPISFFLFGPLFKLSGYLVTRVLSSIKPHLDGVGLNLDGLAAWFVQILRIQECLAMALTFIVLSFTLSMIRKVF